MKARFLALAALVLGLASCQNDFDGASVGAGSEVNFQLSVSAPELGATRAEDKDGDTQNGYDSAFGAIDYLSDADWANVDLRYSLEVYDKAANYDGAMPIKDRMVIITDKYEPVTFDLRLVPNRDYHFVVFADFVPEGSVNATDAADQPELGLRHKIGANLGDITIVEKDANEKAVKTINDELGDAYFAVADVVKLGNNSSSNIVLKRPYGKIRVIATDLAELNLNVDPASVKVNYTATRPLRFNAVSGKVSDVLKTSEYVSVYNEGVGKNSLNNHFYTEGYDAKVENGRHTHMTLFTDYILALNDDEQSSVNFNLEVLDGNGDRIKYTEFSTEIPIQRNHLTTIIGNVLTTATEINVTIDDNFANKDNQYYVFEAFVNGGEVTLTEDYVIGRPLFVEADAVLNLNGHSIKNAEDNADTDVIIVRKGGKLTINGEGTIEAVSGNDGYAIISEGELVINGGTYKSGVDADGAANAVIYARGEGKVFVNGGYFPNDNNSTYVLNKKDADRATTTIEVRGGRFVGFDPMNNAAENAGTNFVADGYASFLEGENTYVVRVSKDFEINEETNTFYAYSANGLLKWSWLANKANKNMNLEVMANITMPLYTVEEDAANETFKYTTTPITITDGKPNGSNWVIVGGYDATKNFYNDRVIGGNDKTISGLTMYSETLVTGFIGWAENSEVRDLTFNNATLYSTNQYTSPLAYMDDGTLVSNVHTKNSYIRGTSYVAGIAAEAMDHYDDANQGLMEDVQAGTKVRRMPVVTIENCTVDANTTISGTGNIVGGIVGQGYGCVIVNCHNQANITGGGETGGIAGHFRDYHYNEYSYIINCTSTNCIVKSNGDNTGGICGKLEEGHDGSCWIVGCYSNATVESAKSYKGSIVGRISGTNKILGCYDNATTFDAVALNAEIADYNTFAANYTFSAYTHKAGDKNYHSGRIHKYTPEDCIYNVTLPQCTLW